MTHQYDTPGFSALQILTSAPATVTYAGGQP